MMKHGSLFSGYVSSSSREVTDVLAHGEHSRIERIVSHGQASPPGFWYEQSEDEFVILLRGSATLAFADGEEHALEPGHWLLIPARCRHRVVATAVNEDTVWLAVFAPPGTWAPPPDA